jgi:hypothetical protein
MVLASGGKGGYTPWRLIGIRVNPEFGAINDRHGLTLYFNFKVIGAENLRDIRKN